MDLKHKLLPLEWSKKESLVKHMTSKDVPRQIISILSDKRPLTNIAGHAPGQCFMTTVDMLFEAVGLITHKRTQMAQMTVPPRNMITPMPL